MNPMQRTKPVKVKPRTGTSGKRGVGSYARQACDVCRERRSKCSGTKPICLFCAQKGHECTWGIGNTKNIINKQYVDALKSRVEALESQLANANAQLEIFREQRTELKETRPDFTTAKTSEPGVRPNPLVENDDSIQELCTPVEQLVLDRDELLLYGPASVFRFTPRAESTSRFSSMDVSQDQTYTLMIEGASLEHYDPNFDWSRYLPKDTSLDRFEHDRSIDLFTKFFTSWCQRLVPALFLRDMFRCLSTPPSLAPPRTAHYSPMLHNALMSLATAFSDDPQLSCLKTREKFAAEAKKHLESELQQPNISAIQALTLLGTFYSSQGNQTLGYMHFGLSIRTNHAMGLNVDCSRWVSSGLITYDDMLDRYWTHWTTFCQDVCWSLYVGRETTVKSPARKADVPVPFIDPDFDNLPFHHAPSNIPPQPQRLSITFAATCELMLIARHINDLIAGGGFIDEETTSRIDLQLTQWEQQLPPQVKMSTSDRRVATPHRLMLYMAYWWQFIILHRSKYPHEAHGVPRSGIYTHAKICDNAAKNILELLEAWQSLYTLRYVPITLIQIIFGTGTVFVLSAVRALSGLRVAQVSLAKSITQVEKCVAYLNETGRSWDCAIGIADTLRNLLQRHMSRFDKKGKKIASRVQPTPPTPTTSDRQLPSSLPPSNALREAPPLVDSASDMPMIFDDLFGDDANIPLLGTLGGEGLPFPPFIHPSEFTFFDAPPLDTGYWGQTFSDEDWAAMKTFLNM